VTPLVTVVIPVLDRARCIGDAIASVLAQTGPELEVVVVDDGSTDGTPEVVRELAGADRRVRLVERPHGGPSAARNEGIRQASAPLVTFLDSDDLMPPGRMARQVALLDELDVDGVHGRYESAVMDGVVLPQWLQDRPDWLRGWDLTAVLVRRGALDDVGGFDEELRLGEDLDLIVRLREGGWSVAAADEVFVIKRWFGDNLTYELDATGPALSQVLRRHMARARPPR